MWCFRLLQSQYHQEGNAWSCHGLRWGPNSSRCKFFLHFFSAPLSMLLLLTCSGKIIPMIPDIEIALSYISVNEKNLSQKHAAGFSSSLVAWKDITRQCPKQSLESVQLTMVGSYLSWFSSWGWIWDWDPSPWKYMVTRRKVKSWSWPEFWLKRENVSLSRLTMVTAMYLAIYYRYLYMW